MLHTPKGKKQTIKVFTSRQKEAKLNEKHYVYTFKPSATNSSNF